MCFLSCLSFTTPQWSLCHLFLFPSGGYGSTAINLLRRTAGTLEFPLTLGRDLSGEVVAVGGAVGRFRPGDMVWAAVGPQRQGTHAEYVTAAAGSVSEGRGRGIG